MMEDRVDRRKFLKVLGTVTGLGLFPSCFREIVRKPKVERIETTVKEESLREKWEKAVNLDGVLLTSELLNKYAGFVGEESIDGILLESSFSLKDRVLESMKKDYELFCDEVLPENYTHLVFLKSLDTFTIMNHLQRYSGIAKMFSLDERNIGYNELKRDFRDYSADEKARKMLNCALLILYQKMEPILSSKPEDVIGNLNAGVGCCKEYSNGAAGLYLKLCDMLNSPNLKSRVRTVLGANVASDGELFREEMHMWISLFENGIWNSYEVYNSDSVETDDKIDSSVEVLRPLSDFERRNNLYSIPLLSSGINNGRLGYWMHVNPRVIVNLTQPRAYVLPRN